MNKTLAFLTIFMLLCVGFSSAYNLDYTAGVASANANCSVMVAGWLITDINDGVNNTALGDATYTKSCVDGGRWTIPFNESYYISSVTLGRLYDGAGGATAYAFKYRLFVNDINIYNGTNDGLTDDNFNISVSNVYGDNLSIYFYDFADANKWIVVNELYASGTSLNPNLFGITASDAWNGSAINVFSAYLNSSWYHTTNGTINTGINGSLGLEFDIDLNATGYVDRTYTDHNTSVDLAAVLIPANSVSFYFYDDSFNLLSQEVNSTLDNGYNSYSFNTSSGDYNLSDVVTGTYNLESITSGYNDVNMFVTMAAGSHQTVNVYFNNLTLANKTFNVFDGGRDPIGDAVISFTRLINGTIIVVEQIITDFSGSARAQLSEITNYGLVASKAGFTTFTGNVTPIADTYTISLLGANVNRFTSSFDDIVYSNALTYVFNNTYADMEFEVFSAAGFLQYYGMNFTYLGVPYDVNISGVPGGGVININITNVNVSVNQTVDVTFWFKSVNHTFATWNDYFYLVDVVPVDASLTEGLFDSSGMSDSLKAVVAGLIILALVLIGFGVSKRSSVGALMGFIGVGLMWSKEFLPRNLSIIAMIVIVVVFVADMKRQGGNL